MCEMCRQLLVVGRWFPPGTPVSFTRKLISTSFHRLDMTLAVAEALTPNKPNQTNPGAHVTHLYRDAGVRIYIRILACIHAYLHSIPTTYMHSQTSLIHASLIRMPHFLFTMIQ